MDNNLHVVNAELAYLRDEILNSNLTTPTKINDPVRGGSLKFFMTTQPDSELDRLAIENNNMFFHRFGIERNRAVRQQLIKMKNMHGFSDRDIKKLCRCGILEVTHTKIQMKNSLFYPIAGWLPIFLISAFYLPIMLQYAFAELAPSKQMIIELATGGVWFGSCYFFSQQFLLPWRIARRAEK